MEMWRPCKRKCVDQIKIIETHEISTETDTIEYQHIKNMWTYEICSLGNWWITIWLNTKCISIEDARYAQLISNPDNYWLSISYNDDLLLTNIPDSKWVSTIIRIVLINLYDFYWPFRNQWPISLRNHRLMKSPLNNYIIQHRKYSSALTNIVLCEDITCSFLNKVLIGINIKNNCRFTCHVVISSCIQFPHGAHSTCHFHHQIWYENRFPLLQLNYWESDRYNWYHMPSQHS